MVPGGQLVLLARSSLVPGQPPNLISNCKPHPAESLTIGMWLTAYVEK